MDGRLDGCMDRLRDGWLDGQVDGQLDGLNNGWVVVLLEGAWVINGGKMDECVDAQCMREWMIEGFGWMDGWMEGTWLTG